MAQASVTTKTTKTIALTLTEAEAQVLADLSYFSIGGNPTLSRRSHMDDIAQALAEAGVRANVNAKDITDVMQFKTPGTTSL